MIISYLAYLGLAFEPVQFTWSSERKSNKKMYYAKVVLSSTQHQSGDICTSLVTGPFRESDTQDGVLPEFL